MKHLLIISLISLLNSCASGPSQQDIVNKAHFKITQNISRHDYDNAKIFLTNDLANKSEISIVTNQNGNNKEVEIPVIKLNEFISELQSFKKSIDTQCPYDGDSIAKAIEEDKNELIKSNQARLFDPNISKLEFLKNCFSKITSPKSNYPRDYFHLISSFSGKDSGTILGTLSVECGDKRSNQSSTSGIALCYVKTKVDELDKKLIFEKDALDKKLKEQSEREAEDAKNQLAKKDADGTSIQKSYCWTLHVLKSTQEQLDHEMKINKEVGLVNKQRVYDYGNTLVQFKERKLLQEKEFKRLTGKGLSGTSCK